MYFLLEFRTTLMSSGKTHPVSPNWNPETGHCGRSFAVLLSVWKVPQL
jgi:hypothetical protein